MAMSIFGASIFGFVLVLIMIFILLIILAVKSGAILTEDSKLPLLIDLRSLPKTGKIKTALIWKKFGDVSKDFEFAGVSALENFVKVKVGFMKTIDWDVPRKDTMIIRGANKTLVIIGYSVIKDSEQEKIGDMMEQVLALENRNAELLDEIETRATTDEEKRAKVISELGEYEKNKAFGMPRKR